MHPPGVLREALEQIHITTNSDYGMLVYSVDLIGKLTIVGFFSTNH
jgi:hypothetical protein